MTHELTKEDLEKLPADAVNVRKTAEGVIVYETPSTGGKPGDVMKAASPEGKGKKEK